MLPTTAFINTLSQKVLIIPRKPYICMTVNLTYMRREEIHNTSPSAENIQANILQTSAKIMKMHEASNRVINYPK